MRKVPNPASQENAHPGRLGRDIRVAVHDIANALLALHLKVDSGRPLVTVLETRPTVDLAI